MMVAIRSERHAKFAPFAARHASRGPPGAALARVATAAQSESKPIARNGGVMHLIWTLVVGLVVGAVAKLIMPGRDGGGIIATLLLGIAGSFIAGFVGKTLGWYQDPGTAPGMIASVVGALVLLGIYRMAIGRGVGRHDKRYDRPAHR
jgi:uncharacterized membrane protein YeaQ/YmgE (transglycosylase-associated protein family)